jgi:hypothetical protein
MHQIDLINTAGTPLYGYLSFDLLADADIQSPLSVSAA